MTYEHLLTLIRRQIAATPDAVAMRHRVGSEWRGVTYREVGRHVDAVASWLIDAGVEPGARVVLYGHNSPWWSIADLAIMAAGASSSLIIANEQALDTLMDYESVPNVGAQLGSASVIVIDDSVSIPWLINKTIHFFRHESCGKCTPCREGTFWMSHLTERIAHDQAQPEDVDLLYEVASQMRGKCLCALGEFSIEAVTSGIDRFRSDFDRRELQAESGRSESWPPDGV